MIIDRVCDNNPIMGQEWKWGIKRTDFGDPLKMMSLNGAMNLNSQSIRRTLMSQALIFLFNYAGSAPTCKQFDFLGPQ